MKLSEWLKKENIPWDSIKALSVRQPFASLIVIGGKIIEWRSKPIAYRGPLIICASKNPQIRMNNGKLLPTGAAIGVVNLVDCRPMKKKDLVAACCEDWRGAVTGYAWVLEHHQEVIPVPVKGIVAPWPWAKRQGIDLEFCPDWHKKEGIW